MRTSAWLLCGISLSLACALAAACGSGIDVGGDVGGDGGGTCPCTVGNSGISFTIPCGGSECLSLNGTATGYTCDSTGTHVDPAACNTPPGDGGTSDTGRHDGATVDAHHAGDGATTEASLPEASLLDAPFVDGPG